MALDRQNHAALLENLMVSNKDVIYFKDLESRFIKVNEACVRKHGMETAEGLIGKTDFDLYAPVHAEQAYADEQHILQTGEILRGIEEKEVWADGHITWASTTKLPLRNADGEIIGTFGVSRDITDHKIAQLSAKRYADEVRQIKDEMENDVRMASELLKNFMPKEYPVFPEGADPASSCIEFLHREVLCGEISGDFCSVTAVSKTEVAVVICDVQGIGIRSALTIALIRGIMQEISDLIHIPGAYLGRMNEMLYPSLGETAALDVTACLMVLDVSSGQLRFASAGHPMPILLRPGCGAAWLCEDPEAYGPAMGRLEKASFSTSSFQLHADDAMLLFTDGLFSVPNNMDHAFGLKRLMDSAQSLVGDPLEDMFDGLVGDTLAFSKNGKFIDDVCIVGFHLKRLLNRSMPTRER
jgi:sigma-B regulation protein RsbU (phosphoserine phosphatase)